MFAFCSLPVERPLQIPLRPRKESPRRRLVAAGHRNKLRNRRRLRVHRRLGLRLGLKDRPWLRLRLCLNLCVCLCICLSASLSLIAVNEFGTGMAP